MDVLNEIRNRFANSAPDYAYLIKGIDSDYPAWVVRTDTDYGMAVPYNGEMVNEEFANAYLYSAVRNIGNSTQTYLFLTCSVENARNEFATICTDFIEPGKEGKHRAELISEPVKWWSRWKIIIGNAIVEKKPYSVLGELMTYGYLKKQGKKPKWTGADFASHDIECTSEEYEVKSTTSRYEKTIRINGQYQLAKPGNVLYLFFCRFEEDNNGLSIDDAVENLVSSGESEDYLNKQLEKLGYRPGNSSRHTKYKCLEVLRYVVDEGFPQITPHSFTGGVIPAGIKKIKAVFAQ